MINAIIVDDEENAISNLSSLLARYCTDIDIIATAQTIIEAELAIRRKVPDVIFLDVEMPEGNGFDLLENIKDLDVKVIFVTAYDSYALEAFRVNAINYLLKPVNPELLIAAVGQFKESMSIQEVLESMNKVNKHERIKVPTMNGFEMVSMKEILYVKSKGVYSQLILKDSSNLLLSKNIGVVESMLDSAIFFRSHKEYIINIREVQKYLKGRGGDVLLSNGITIPVAARRKQKLIGILDEL